MNQEKWIIITIIHPQLKNTNIQINNAAEAFSRYFWNLADRLKTDNFKIDSALAVIRNLFPDSFPEMIIIHITEAEIICTIASLKNKNQSVMIAYQTKFWNYAEITLVNFLHIFSINH
jgi:hypothetical protein